jgi:secreted trypsin-like serine protease
MFFFTGDGGGPLIDKDLGVQIGIAGFTYGPCASNDYPDIFTNIASYNGWIASQLTDDSCDGAAAPTPAPTPTDDEESDCFCRWCSSARKFMGGIF